MGAHRLKHMFLIAFVLHAIIIFMIYLSDISNPGEDWSWMAAFFLDFPASIGIHWLLRLTEEHALLNTNSCGLFISHTIIGGAWWYVIVVGIRMVFTKK